MEQLISIDLPPFSTALFSGIACALLGNYLLLRRLSMMGDAISHSVLPGIVIAFLLTSSREIGAVFLGAAAAAILSALAMEAVRRLGKVESGASMGVVFSIFFALGVLLLEQAAARSVDLDADCLLHGQLETIFWFPPTSMTEFFSFSTLAQVPSEMLSSFFVMLLAIAFVLVLYKELKITSFDPALAACLGYRPSMMYYGLMIVVAAAIVASFKAVGSILVISMIICPPATARLFTDSLKTQLILSVVFVSLMVFFGYFVGAFAPLLLGYHSSVNIAGSIAVVGGVAVLASVLFSPSYGVLGRIIRDRRFARKVASEDLLSWLYRREEISSPRPTTDDILRDLGENLTTRKALRNLLSQNFVTKDPVISLTPLGRREAIRILKTHRLWETYLVSEGSLPIDHVHDSAETIEHFTQEDLLTRLAAEGGYPETDPHGRVIPGLPVVNNKKDGK